MASKGFEANPDATDAAAGGSRERARERLRVLSRIESVLEGLTPEETAEPAGIAEVALPEDMRHETPAARGFRMGELQIIFEPKEGPPYGHLSVSHPARYPTVEELLGARTAPGGEGEEAPNLWALLPKPEQALKMQSTVVHLYVLPPESLLG